MLVAGPADADHTRLSSLDARIAEARSREAALQGEIDSLASRIRRLEADAGDVSARLASLEDDLRLRQRRLDVTNALFAAQSERLGFLQRQEILARVRLERRLIAIYEEHEPSTIEIVLTAGSFGDAMDSLELVDAVAAQDQRLADEVRLGRVRTHAARVRTAHARKALRSEIRIVTYRRDQAAVLRDRLARSRQGLSGARTDRLRTLRATQDSESEWLAEAAALRRANAAVASSIIAAQPAAPPPAQASSSGLIWPVGGPITSPYGMRWGSLHPGIDIGAGMGTPIRAAADGTVVLASYDGGYGNLIVIDHGNGIATAYAHQSQLAAGVGQHVSQGQVIGFVGSTGFSTGPHLHFEVRVNGSAVDPLGYL